MGLKCAETNKREMSEIAYRLYTYNLNEILSS